MAVIDCETGEVQHIDQPIPDPAPVTVVSAMQFQRALNQSGLYTAVDTAIAGSGDLDLQIYWAKTSEFHRDHPKVAQMAQALGYTDAQVDAVFALAATLS